MIRKWISIICCLLCVQALLCQVPSNVLSFTERVFHFGTIEEAKGKVSHTFEFTNKGNTTVSIDEVHSGCGCIGNVVTKGAIKPGERGKVTVTFDPGYKSGFFSKEIVVLSNNRQHFNRVWVEGVIEPMEHPVENEYPYAYGNGLHLRYKVMAFGYLKPGFKKQMELPYANDTDQEMNLAFLPQTNIPGLRFTNPGKIAPKAKGIITMEYTMPLHVKDDVVLRLQPLVNGKKLSETLEVKILYEKGDKNFRKPMGVPLKRS